MIVGVALCLLNLVNLLNHQMLNLVFVGQRCSTFWVGKDRHRLATNSTTFIGGMATLPALHMI